MKTILATLLATTFIAGTAVAETDWSGVYAGAAASSNSGNMDYDNNGNVTAYAMSTSPLYGAFAGYNMQNGAMVYGVELAYSVGELSFDGYPDDFINSFFDAKVRVGYAAGQALIYAVAGGTAGQYIEEEDPYFIDFTGINYGVGVDYKINDKMFAGIEYLMRDVGGEYRDYPLERGDFQTQSIQARIGYKF